MFEFIESLKIIPIFAFTISKQKNEQAKTLIIKGFVFTDLCLQEEIKRRD